MARASPRSESLVAAGGWHFGCVVESWDISVRELKDFPSPDATQQCADQVCAGLKEEVR
jgi:hypothetical protein